MFQSSMIPNAEVIKVIYSPVESAIRHPFSVLFLRRLGKKPTLSARVCQDAECHVILVDRKKRPTVHAKTPSPKCVDKPVVTSNALPSPQSASESLDEVSKQSSVPLSSEPEGENADSRERIPPQETLGAITEQVPVALPTEPRGGSSNGPERVSPQGGGLPASRGKLSVEVPTEIVLGELATPDADIGPDAK